MCCSTAWFRPQARMRSWEAAKSRFLPCTRSYAVFLGEGGSIVPVSWSEHAGRPPGRGERLAARTAFRKCSDLPMAPVVLRH
jgi:hypothetical protein